MNSRNMMRNYNMMKNRENTFLSYVIGVLSIVIVATGILYLLGKPLYQYGSAMLHVMVVKGEPNYSNEYANNSVFIDIKHLEEGEVLIPKENTMYGYIRGESMELYAPIYYGDNEDILLKGVGHYIGSGLPGEGKPILLGAHDATYFAPLAEVEIGDAIWIDTEYGRHNYIVRETRIVMPEDDTAYDLRGDKEELILYTCYPFGELLSSERQRFFVYCDKDLNQEATKEVTRSE